MIFCEFRASASCRDVCFSPGNFFFCDANQYFFGALRFHAPACTGLGRAFGGCVNHPARHFPLVGLIVGLMGRWSLRLASSGRRRWPKLLAMAATIYVTGAFHEDGRDMVDGLVAAGRANVRWKS